jgi:hypothetical protein
MKKMVLILMVALMCAVNVMAAGSSCRIVPSKPDTEIGSSKLSIVTFSWTSDDATGAVSAATNAEIAKFMAGKILMLVITDPGSSTPTDNYDITITDEYGVDIMEGGLANRDETTSEQIKPKINGTEDIRLITGALTLAVTNAGNSTTGRVILVLLG